MAAPLVVSFWMRAAVTFVDTIFAATLSDAAVAAVGLAVPFEFLMIAVWVGLSTGLTSALARAMGAREGARIEQYKRACWRLVLAMAPVFLGIGATIWLLAPRSGLAADTARAFQVYGTVLIGGSALSVFWSVIPDSLVKAHQDTRSTMWAGIWTNVLNFSLNVLFVFGFGWGVFGIALSTVLGRFGGLTYALIQAARHERQRVHARATPGVAPDPRPYGAILSLALPASITFALIALEGAVVNALLARLDHATEAIAAYSIYYRIVLFALQPVIASSVAVLPFVAHRWGQGDVLAIRRSLGQLYVALAAYTALVVAPVLWTIAPWIAARLTESPVTRDYTLFALRLVPLACLAGAPFLLCRPAFEGLNRGRPGVVMAAFRYLALTGPLAWLGARAATALGFAPIHGLIVGLLVAAAIASVTFQVWLGSELRARAAGVGARPLPAPLRG
jgi:Na+-driven multidrug efflux pump